MKKIWVPDELYKALQRQARDENCSLEAVVINLLERGQAKGS
jgi:predicted CopG family antitoxin